MITIRSEEENGGTIIAVMFTDVSGVSDIISLPTPPRENSLSPQLSPEETVEESDPGAASGSLPDAGSQPVCSFYTVDTDCDGYYSVVNNGVPVFEGVTAIQQVLLVPRADGFAYPGDLTRYNASQLPNL